MNSPIHPVAQSPSPRGQPTVAIIGASADRRKFGNKAVRAFAAKGYRVFPIHPAASEIEGHKAYRSILDVPAEKLDRASLYLPPSLGVQVLEEIASKRVTELWVNPGAESDELFEKAERLGINMIFACSIVGVGVSPAELE
jgi:predicted CoA-binding protein